jgi:hypothetical protein
VVYQNNMMLWSKTIIASIGSHAINDHVCAHEMDTYTLLQTTIKSQLLKPQEISSIAVE